MPVRRKQAVQSGEGVRRMGFSLIPDLRVHSVLQLTPALLRAKGITLLLLDLDNTLAPYTGSDPTPQLCSWRDGLLAAGITPFIVSNTKTERAKQFSEKWGVQYINHAGKPGTEGILRAISIAGGERKHAALAGDQVFTDVLGANRAGILSIATFPLELKNPLYALRYAAELPFRCCRKQIGGVDNE